MEKADEMGLEQGTENFNLTFRRLDVTIRESGACMRNFVCTGTGEDIAPGCEIPKDTPVENVIAMQEAIEEN